MSIGEEAEKRRELIKSLRSKRAKLLNQRHLSMKGRRMSAAAQQAAQQDTQEQILKRATRISIYERYVR